MCREFCQMSRTLGGVQKVRATKVCANSSAPLIVGEPIIPTRSEAKKDLESPKNRTNSAKQFAKQVEGIARQKREHDKNKHKLFGRDGVRDKTGTVPGTNCGPSLGQTGPFSV